MTEIKLGGGIEGLLLTTVQGNANEDRLHKEFWHLNEDLWRIFGMQTSNAMRNGHIKILFCDFFCLKTIQKTVPS